MHSKISCLLNDFEKLKVILGGYFHICITIFSLYSYAFRDFLVICIIIILINRYSRPTCIAHA
jgi:hypothetical protein